MAFALLSVAPVAWSLQIPLEPWRLEELEPSNLPLTYQRMRLDQAVVLATSVVLPAAVFGGFLGGLLRRGFPVGGAFLAVSVSWLTGVSLLPLVANLLEIPLTAGVSCFMTCSVHLRDDQPLGGAAAYASSIGSSLFFVWFWLVPLVFLILAARWNTGDSLVPIFFALLLHAGLHSTAIIAGGTVPYFCLAIGVFLWSLILRERDRHRQSSV